MDYERDVPKYRKRSKKSVKKTDHKHTYTWCVFSYRGDHYDPARGFVKDGYLSYKIGSYCPVCGKIYSTETNDPRWSRLLPYWPDARHERERWTDEALREFDERTRTLPCFFLKDRWFQKYVGEEVSE